MIDMGQSDTKYGLLSASSDIDTSNDPIVQPTVVSVTYPTTTNNLSKKQSSTSTTCIGHSATKLMKQLRKVGQSDTEMTLFQYPIQNGRVANWDAIQSYYQSILCPSSSTATATTRKSKNSLIVTSDPVCAPLSDRQQLCEMLIENMGCEQLIFEASGVLNMRNHSQQHNNNNKSSSSSSSSGIAVDLGVSRTTIIPILNHQPLYHCATSLSGIAGQSINTYLMDLLRQSGYIVEATEVFRVSEHIKKSMAYCSVDFKKEMDDMVRNPSEFSQELELSTGEKVLIGNGEAFKCVEPLFNPELIGNLNSVSLQKSLYDTVQNHFSKEEDKRALYSNIVLSGGTSLLVGLQDRLSAELREGLRQQPESESFVDSVHVGYASGDFESETSAGAWYGAQQWIQDIGAGKCQPINNWITKQLLAEHGKDRIVKKNCY